MIATLSRRNLLGIVPALAVSKSSTAMLGPALLRVQDGRPPASEPPPGSIAALAASKGAYFGSAIDFAELDDPAVLRIYREQCSSITPRNALKWTATEPRRREYRWGTADRIAAFGRTGGLRGHGHTLIWYRMPGWVAKIDSARVLEAAMNARIDTAMRRYAGFCNRWDVVNEPLEYEQPKFRNSVFQKLLGQDYVERAFRRAHAADPKAQLVLNETHLEKRGANYSARREMFLKLVQSLVSKGVPIHAIGLQGHFRPLKDELDEKELGSFCRALDRMGLAVHITELDASCRYTAKFKKMQDPVYGSVFERVIVVAGSQARLRGLTMWGIAERHNDKVRGNPIQGCTAPVTLYTADLKPRGTVDHVRRGLAQLPARQLLA